MNQIIKKKVDFFNEFIISIGIVENNYVIINETICKSNDVHYTSKLKYSKSSHYIEYYFYVLM